MNKLTVIFVALFAILTMINAEDSTGQKVFDTKCVACHTEQMPEKMSDLKAPPMAKISAKIKYDFDDNKTQVISFIEDYIQNPSQEKAKCMGRAIKNFGLMPPIGKAMTKEEREVVATWVFENFNQKWEAKDCKSGNCKGKDKKESKCGAGKCGSEKSTTAKKCGSEKNTTNSKCGTGKCGGK